LSLFDFCRKRDRPIGFACLARSGGPVSFVQCISRRFSRPMVSHLDAPSGFFLLLSPCSFWPLPAHFGEIVFFVLVFPFGLLRFLGKKFGISFLGPCESPLSFGLTTILFFTGTDIRVLRSGTVLFFSVVVRYGERL